MFVLNIFSLTLQPASEQLNPNGTASNSPLGSQQLAETSVEIKQE
jgi:hypothetical protein